MSIRANYQEYGVQKYYEEFGHCYRNPHEPQIQVGLPKALKIWSNLLKSPKKIIDLASGSGEISLIFEKLFDNIEIIGIDPYTSEAYTVRTKRRCHKLSFEDIAKYNFEEDLKCDFMICSYALHLVPPSYLWQLLTVISQLTSYLIIITPHKNPQINLKTGWKLISEQRFPNCHQRYRLYQAYNH